ncbi:MAG TPA: winged helix DNA-binding domain-containing protein [Longimicrobiaceae bacterium]|nr:winged helix DNA-binding domain-containing protein [Longimicrobiaceae bacterium]
MSVAQHMGAMQAQDYYGTLWALGLRTGKTEREVIKAFEDAEIVRTWPQRGTLHVVPAVDAKWLVSLSEERLIKGAASRREALGLTDEILGKARDTLVGALQGRKLLSRPRIMEVLEDAGISTKSGRGYHILWYLSQTGVTVVGPMEGKQQTFALLDDWVPNARTLSREEGIAELARRYFTSHGPATVKDFGWWTGLTAADAKVGLAANRSALISAKVDRHEYWFAGDTPTGEDQKGDFLLPGFDEYMLGYKNRDAALRPEQAENICPGKNGMFLSTIILGGQVVGTWKRTVRKGRVEIALSPFKRLSREDKARLEEPANAYGRFLDLPAVITT